MSDPRSDARLTDDHRHTGFGGELGLGTRPALPVVDLVRAYLDPDSPPHAPTAPAALERPVPLLDDARRLGRPVVDRDPRPHEAALFGPAAKYADVRSGADIIAAWGHPAGSATR